MRVSVVVPDYGHGAHLAEIVAAICDGSDRPDEVIVSHSGPHNPASSLKAKFPDVKVLHEDKQLFPGAARNRGAALARNEILAFCDSDTRPDADWLAQITEPLKHTPDVFVVGAVGTARSGGYWGMSNWLLEFSEQAPWRPAGSQKGGASCNMAVTATAFRAVGGFRESMRGSEDTNLFLELRGLGLKQVFQPTAIVRHFNNSGFSAFARHQKILGRAFAELRTHKDLPGSGLVRNPPLALLLTLPKAYFVLRRSFGGGFRASALTIFLLPGVLLGSLIWGFACLRRSVELRRN